MPGSHAMKKYQAGGYVGPDYSELWKRQAEANNRKWEGLNQPAPAQPIHRIAPPPAMSANAQKVMASAMVMPSRNMGEAVSKLANVWASKRANEREAEAGKLYNTERNRKRADWIGALSEGATPQFLAYTDPSFVDDKEFHAWWESNKPGAEPEQWDTVQDPYGRGGAAQRSSTTGLFKNYQGPLATPKEPERRTAKEPERRTAKDARGRLRFLDDESPVFPDQTLGACAVEVLMLGDWRAAAGEVGFWPECGHLARPTLGWKSQTGRQERKRFAFHIIRGRWALRAPEQVRWQAIPCLSTWPPSPSA